LEFEKAREVLRSKLKRAEERLRFLEVEKEKGLVRAPISGKVISDARSKEQSFVLKGEFLLTLAGGEPLLEFTLKEEDYGLARVGDPARIRFWAFPGKVYRGEVLRIKHYAEPLDKHGFKTTILKALIRLDEIPPGLRNGMTARVSIKGRKTSLFDSLRRRI
jgi:hypothetical protein